ncbi:hypothetical protein AB834_02985 [PVC group bacterium (ex Bugula neritina AB1)]|nr:hypothetical protein AB834_02985 [PVC group bacterium (ex Bugula neritina AB1)]
MLWLGESFMTYKVSLDQFEGPLDLLLHLIKKDKIDIYDIPISRLLDQYLEYISLMKILDIDVTAEFLVMIATLMLIKSKMLLPKIDEEQEEEDPRTDLVEQLKGRQVYKELRAFLEQQEKDQRGVFSRGYNDSMLLGEKEQIYSVSLFDMVELFDALLKKKKRLEPYSLPSEEISIEICMEGLLSKLDNQKEYVFESLFTKSDTGEYWVGMFLGLLELVRLKNIKIVQQKIFGPIVLSKINEKCFDQNLVLNK